MKLIRHIGLVKVARPSSSGNVGSTGNIGTFVNNSGSAVPADMLPFAKKVEDAIKGLPALKDVNPDEEDIGLLKDILSSESAAAAVVPAGSSQSIKSVYPAFHEAVDNAAKSYALWHPMDAAGIYRKVKGMGPSGAFGLLMDMSGGNKNITDILYSGMTNNYARVSRENGLAYSWEDLKKRYAEAQQGDKIQINGDQSSTAAGAGNPAASFVKTMPRKS